MSDAIVGLIGSVIVGILTLCGAIYQSKKNNDVILTKMDEDSKLADAKLEARLEKYQAVTDTKIDELCREVREHNNFAKRMPVLEEKVAAIEKRVS